MSAHPAAVHPVMRRLTLDDLDRIMAIEVAAYPYPWTRGIFSDCIQVGYDCWGLQAEGGLIGYCIQSHVAGESHLLNLCVSPEQQRRGFGRVLLDHALRRGRDFGCDRLFLEVRPSNEAAIALYLKYGFSVVGQRPDYYSAGDKREDAIVMRLDL